MPSVRCPRCHRTIYRTRRRWFERLLLVKEAYRCSRCHRRRYRTRVFGLML